MTNKPKSLFLFYLLVIYIFFQFVWWSYMLLQLNSKVYANTGELHKRWMMVLGEGLVFMALLGYGVLKIRQYLKKEAEMARQQKNIMLAVTHELRSPLASIKLMFETIQKRELEKSKLMEIASAGIKDTDRLNNLVENILLAASIEENEQISKEQINFSEYISEVVKKASFIYGENHKIISEISTGIHFSIDKMNFQSVIYNLLENAVKYSPSQSVVKISLVKKDSKIILSVADEGAGIPDEEKQKIFERFYRSGNEETRSSKGTGLGLYIVKRLVQLHGGSISVKNNSPKGTVFEVVFR